MLVLTNYFFVRIGVLVFTEPVSSGRISEPDHVYCLYLLVCSAAPCQLCDVGACLCVLCGYLTSCFLALMFPLFEPVIEMCVCCVGYPEICLMFFTGQGYVFKDVCLCVIFII